MTRRRADKSAHLCVAGDGRIWWPLTEAQKLVLPANDMQSAAERKRLTAAFRKSRGEDDIPIPQIAKRSGVACVDAAEYMEWVSQYIALTQASIPFPTMLARDVRRALAEHPRKRRATQSTPMPEDDTLREVLLRWGWSDVVKDREHEAAKAKAVEDATTAAIKTARSDGARQAAKARHAGDYAERKRAIEWHQQHRAEFKSVAAAARAFTKIEPSVYAVVYRWLLGNKDHP